MRVCATVNTPFTPAYIFVSLLKRNQKTIHMEKYFNMATFGTLAVFALVLYLIMYFTKPAPASTTETD